MSQMLPRITRIVLLGRVGQAPTPGVKSWVDALAPERVERWGHVQLEGANRIRDAVQKRSMDRYRDWNLIVDDAQPRAVAVLESSGVADRVPAEIRKDVIAMMRWDLLNAMIEEAYAELDVPTFFRDLVAVYEAGHLPCDWIGEFPAGELVVY